MLVPAKASEYPASKFINQCRKTFTSNPLDNQATIDIAYCMGVMAGLKAANMIFREEKSEYAFCDPEKFTNKERAETFIMIAEKNLEIRELAGELAAQVALYQAFPCKYD